jgi:outer membrane protein insertion porin family
MEIEEGELFSETKLERSRRRIMSLGYFERVDVSTEQGSASPTRINVNLEVGERPTGTFQVGAGFSSIESFIATAQVQQANLFGTGQSLSIQGQVSGLRQLINIRCFEPYFLDYQLLGLRRPLRPAPDLQRLLASPAPAARSPSATRSSTRVLRLHRSQPPARQGQHETTSTFLGTASFGQRVPAAPPGQPLQLRHHLQRPPHDLLRHPRQPPLPHQRRLPLRLRPSSPPPPSAARTSSSATAPPAASTYPVGGNVVLKLNTESGVVTSPNAAGVPIFARFFLGGILDVRGYRLRTLGPRLPLNAALDPNSRPITNGANIGGNLMYYQNLELEFPIIQQVGVRGVIFTDLGNAWNLETPLLRRGQRRRR